MPWDATSRRLRHARFKVVSIHFAPADVTSGPNAQSNRETGASARAVLAALASSSSRPTPPTMRLIIAGDFAGGYGVWGDPNPAQPDAGPRRLVGRRWRP